jgi:Ca2+-binding RTX toxin-like protein
MTKILIGNQTTTFDVQNSDDDLLLAKGKEIDTETGNGIFVSNMLENVGIEVLGTIDAYDSEVTGAGIFNYGVDSVIEVGEAGRVFGNRGMDLRGSNEIVTNRGFIGGEFGISTYSVTATIENYGHIGDGQTSIGIAIHNGNILNAEGARIHGVYGIRFEHASGEGRIENHGLIKSEGEAIIGSFAEEIVINRGRIVGDIETGDGNDRIDLRTGTVEGLVKGGGNDDTYLVNASAGKLAEELDQGFDSVQSQASWTLGANFEQLLLLGKKNFKGTGNDLDNYIDGNKGDNRLKGLGGEDYMTGAKGDDILTGGTDADVFNFIRGGGHDTVTDFEAGIDTIDISAWDGIDSFADLMTNHVKKSGDHLLISSGSDSVLLQNTTKADLSETDFWGL